MSKWEMTCNVEDYENQCNDQEMNNDDHVWEYIFYIDDNVANEEEHLLHIDDSNANCNAERDSLQNDFFPPTTTMMIDYPLLLVIEPDK